MADGSRSGAQCGVDERPRHRPDEGPIAICHNGIPKAPKVYDASASEMPGTKRCPTTAHSPRRWIWVSMRAAHCGPIRAGAVPAGAPAEVGGDHGRRHPSARVTNVPSTGPNNTPLPAASSRPGTNIVASNADTGM